MASHCDEKLDCDGAKERVPALYSGHQRRSTCTRQILVHLSSSICKGSPRQFYKKSLVVASFLEVFVRGERQSLRLADGKTCDGKASSEFEILASSFGLLAIMLRQQPEKSSSSEGSAFV